jgi:hypothetical protein
VVAGDQTLVRLERVSWGEQTKGAPMAHCEWFMGGVRKQDFYGPLSDDERSTLLQIERRGSQLHLRYSDDGSKWEQWQTVTDLNLPSRVLVGLLAVHTTPTEFDPCFEDVRFRDAATTESLSVAAQNPNFPPGSSAGHQTSEFAWGPVRDGWQVGVGWRGGKLRYVPGEPVEFELKIRNTTDAEKMIEVAKPDDGDLWYSGGAELHVRIFGREKQKVTLGPREEKLIEVPKPQIKTDGLVKGFYKVRFTTPLGDEQQQPEAVEFGFHYDGPAGAARTEPLKHPDARYTGVVWGTPVLGLSFGLRAAADGAKEDGVEFFLWNTDAKAIDLEYLEHHALDWQLEFRDKEEKEIRSQAILTGPKVQARRQLAPGEVLTLGTTSLKRLWSAASAPQQNLAPGSYKVSSRFNCRRLDYGHFDLRITSGEAPLEVK